MSDEKAFWGIVELMGHVRIAGKISEEEKFGTKMGRIDIPMGDPAGVGFVTQYFGGSSVYRITAASEDVARAVAAANKIHPVHSYEMPERPALPEPSPETDLDDDEDEDSYF